MKEYKELLSNELKIFLSQISSPLKTESKMVSICLINSSREMAEIFTNTYSSILVQKGFFRSRCKNNYIKVKYPLIASENHIRMLFQTIVDSGITTNRFYGVILLDLTEWNNKNIMHENFQHLLDFIDENKKNICFVIRTKNYELVKCIGEYIQIKEINCDNIPINEYESRMIGFR